MVDTLNQSTIHIMSLSKEEMSNSLEHDMKLQPMGRIFLKSIWDKIVKRVTSGVFYFDLYLLLYNWLRSCILDTDNLREVFYPSEYDDA
ncbi:unnamed protein product [Schistosoma intercalatum]|nr:unnamed protein product [Schistosoma intercalatum]CAH8589453.1 unnamed protein product [Schistosoma intercalatum]